MPHQNDFFLYFQNAQKSLAFWSSDHPREFCYLVTHLVQEFASITQTPSGIWLEFGFGSRLR